MFSRFDGIGGISQNHAEWLAHIRSSLAIALEVPYGEVLPWQRWSRVEAERGEVLEQQRKIRGTLILLSWMLYAMFVTLHPLRLHAHAVLVDSSPKSGSSMKGPDVPISLRFNVRVDGSRSRCTLVLPDGKQKMVAFDPQSKPDILTGKATGLSAGHYKLQWQVLAADGHISRGELTFNLT